MANFYLIWKKTHKILFLYFLIGAVLIEVIDSLAARELELLNKSWMFIFFCILAFSYILAIKRIRLEWDENKKHQNIGRIIAAICFFGMFGVLWYLQDLSSAKKDVTY